MNNRLLHTPEGVRDIYGKEYARKLAVEQKLQKAIHCFGYEDIQTPSLVMVLSLGWGAAGCSNFSMYFPRRSEPHLARNFISFLTRKEIHWC